MARKSAKYCSVGNKMEETKIYPDYYREFKCIGSECRHNCCIGWEIDIDSESAVYYKTVDGKMGERLKRAVSKGEEPHFILGEKERCPFLNEQNLCDIITELGEERLCSICREHPRFHNELPDRVESGVGLACEAAARIILGKSTFFCLEPRRESEDEIIILRDKVLVALQNREKSIEERVCDMLSLSGAALPDKSYREWAEIFLSLERLDESFTERLLKLRLVGDSTDFCRFAEYMKENESEYEQLLCYFIYRHFANAPDLYEAAARAAFAALCRKIIFALGAINFEEKGSLDFDERVDICRLFSSEIEYSDENLHYLFDMLNPDF